VTLLLAFLFGVVSGFRSLAPAAILSWAVQGRADLQASPLAFMTGSIAAYVLTGLALVELVTDKLPFTPSRLMAVPLTARILLGGLCGATLAVAGGSTLFVGGIIGAIGGIAGAFLGYHVRRSLTSSNKVPDLAVALAEDVITIAAAFFLSRAL
jgi:uncharacterized membrane protein